MFKVYCDTCKFVFVGGMWPADYFELNNGERELVLPPGPGLFSDRVGELMKRLTGKSREELLEENKIGRLEDFMCFSCGKVKQLDPEKDDINCSRCGKPMNEVDMFIGSKGLKCPKCKKGTITTGRSDEIV